MRRFKFCVKTLHGIEIQFREQGLKGLEMTERLDINFGKLLCVAELLLGVAKISRLVREGPFQPLHIFSSCSRFPSWCFMNFFPALWPGTCRKWSHSRLT